MADFFERCAKDQDHWDKVSQGEAGFSAACRTPRPSTACQQTAD
jgi:hypothetical protein